MNMLEPIVQYIRSWFPTGLPNNSAENSRKRRGTDFTHYKSPKHRKLISSFPSIVAEDDFFSSPLRSSVLRPLNRAERTVLIDDDNEPTKIVDGKMSRKSLENSPRTNGNDDVTFLKAIKSTTEKKLDAKKAGYEYITRFTSTKSPVRSETNTRSKMSPAAKNSRNLRFPSSSSFSSPTLDYSIRLEDKQRYQQLLENSFNTSSIYGTPLGTPLHSRTKKLVDLSKSPKKPVEVIDLTNERKTKLSTKDRVIKILDDFESSEANVIEDSDSDVEILPNPPSPRPDIKVDPVNSLKTVVDTSKVAQNKWLESVTQQHKQYVREKSKEIEVYSENSSTLEEINKDLLIKSLAKKVKDSLAIRDTILPEIEEEEEVELPKLTNEQMKAVKKAMAGDPNEVLTPKFSLNVTRRDIQTLAGLNWLNDNVINFYMNLIIERGSNSKFPKSYAFNTFFYPKLTSSGPESLKRWTRRIDLFSYEFICVPVHLGMHWCMAIINLVEKTIKYYDSMGKPNNHCLNALRGYLEFEHMDKKNEPFSTKDFVVENVQGIPQQMNGSDCGMFSCTFAEFATRKAKFSFQQEDMPYLRKKMVVEILTGQLLIQ